MNRGSRNLRRDRRAAQGRFNEAPIHESGKYLVQARVKIDQLIASMRPRFMNRGSKATRKPIARGMARFNEAPIHESGKC